MTECDSSQLPPTEPGQTEVSGDSVDSVANGGPEIADSAETATAPAVEQGVVSDATQRLRLEGWFCESFGPKLGFRAGRSVSRGDVHLVLTAGEDSDGGTNTIEVPEAVLRYLLTGVSAS